MELNNENIFKAINNLDSKISAIMNIEFNLETDKVNDILLNYFEISDFLVTKSDTPENVISFIILGDDLIDIKLPQEYEPLKKIHDLYDYIKIYIEKNIQFALEENDYNKIYKLLSFAMKTNVKNIVLAEYIADKFEQCGLNKELIDLYKLMFIYNLNPKYFEKIGDIYYKMEEYQDALDSYLNCAEVSEEYAEIYRKLANVFETINDNDSRLACLSHAEIIEGKHES